MNCDACAAEHQKALRNADCTDNEIKGWCSSSPSPPTKSCKNVNDYTDIYDIDYIEVKPGKKVYM